MKTYDATTISRQHISCQSHNIIQDVVSASSIVLFILSNRIYSYSTYQLSANSLLLSSL